MLQRAWVGDRRAARMAGSSPARAPMTTAAARPPAQASGRDDEELVVAAGVAGGGGGAGDDAGDAAGQGQQDGLGQELGADLASGGAQGAAQPDLGAAFQDGDDHDVGDPDRADQQRDRAQAEEQGVEGALGVGLGGERGRGLGDVDLVRVFRVGLVSEQAVHPGGDGRGAGGADVDLRRVAVEVQVLLGGREADQDRGVDLRGVGVRVEDAGDVEPLAAGPDPHPGPDPVDAQPLGGGGAEHGDGLAFGGGVQEPALRQRGAGRGGQAQGGGVHARGRWFRPRGCSGDL